MYKCHCKLLAVSFLTKKKKVKMLRTPISCWHDKFRVMSSFDSLKQQDSIVSQEDFHTLRMVKDLQFRLSQGLNQLCLAESSTVLGKSPHSLVQQNTRDCICCFLLFIAVIHSFITIVLTINPSITMFTSFVVTTRKRPNYVYPAANLNWQTFTIVFVI